MFGFCSGYPDLSLTARLAVGLHCFHGYCRIRGLDHPVITEFLDDLWRFPVISDLKEFGQWERSHPPLVYVGLGDEFPVDFEVFLAESHVSPIEFRELLGCVVQIVFSSFYGASDNANASRFLNRVLEITKGYGVSPPPIERFSASRFADRHGWGNRLSPAERDSWRYGNQDLT
jgi:hypothetical protein